ncbi:MAG: NUDIX domain-containing protein, partial [Bacteroidota bacterium]
MYKIYINETPLFLVNTKGLVKFSGGADILIARYNGKVKNLLNYIDLLEKSQRFRMVVLHTPELAALWTDFKALFKIHEAAGGLVLNERSEIVAFFRRGSWDLPKGKIDPGESREEAALREVEEEVGLQDLQLGDFLLETFHTYRSRSNKR